MAIAYHSVPYGNVLTVLDNAAFGIIRASELDICPACRPGPGDGIVELRRFALLAESIGHIGRRTGSHRSCTFEVPNPALTVFRRPKPETSE